MHKVALSDRKDLVMSSEADLVTLARLGDESAIRALIKRNNERLFRVARSVLKSDFEAEDVVQETYAKAFTKLDTFRGEARFSTWLTRIALNEAIGRKRRARAAVDVTEIDVAAFANGGSLPKPPMSLAPMAADAELVRNETRKDLERVIDELPASFKSVLVLRDLEELDVQETADLLGLKPATVKTRLHRAHRLLRTALGRDLPEPSWDAFPFDGSRCVEMANRVIWYLRWMLARDRAHRQGEEPQKEGALELL
jgi:RNA polymerase sigma-70 factor (ECF subfamily)